MAYKVGRVHSKQRMLALVILHSRQWSVEQENFRQYHHWYVHVKSLLNMWEKKGSSISLIRDFYCLHFSTLNQYQKWHCLYPFIWKKWKKSIFTESETYVAGYIRSVLSEAKRFGMVVWEAFLAEKYRMYDGVLSSVEESVGWLYLFEGSLNNMVRCIEDTGVL